MKTLHFSLVASALALMLVGSAPAAHLNHRDGKSVKSLQILIVEIQHSEVTVGGTEANPGYSDVDLQRFKSGHRLNDLMSTFKHDSRFGRGIVELKKFPATKQNTVLHGWDHTADLTWAENGRVGDGVTDAGKEAEWIIVRRCIQVVRNALHTRSK